MVKSGRISGRYRMLLDIQYISRPVKSCPQNDLGPYNVLSGTLSLLTHIREFHIISSLYL